MNVNMYLAFTTTLLIASNFSFSFLCSLRSVPPKIIAKGTGQST